MILVGEGIVMWSLLGSCALKTSGARDDWLPLDALHTIQYRTLQSAGSSRCKTDTNVKSTEPYLSEPQPGAVTMQTVTDNTCAESKY